MRWSAGKKLVAAIVFATGLFIFYWPSIQVRIALLSEVDDVITTDSEPRTPEAGYCMSQEQIYPGRVYKTSKENNSFVWVPSSGCELHHFRPTDASACLNGLQKKIAFFGDSLIDDLADAIARRSNSRHEFYDPPEGIEGRWWRPRPNRGFFLAGQTTPFLEFFWTQSAFYNDPTDPSRENASFAIRNADIVLLNNAMWDIGDSCQGVHAYYHALKTRVEKVQSVVKPGALLVLYDLHWIWPNQCAAHKGQDSKCFVYNPVARVKHYRTALRLVAACTGVRLMSDTDMTKFVPQHTTDGVHYDTDMVKFMKADLFLNGICTRGESAPMEFPILPRASCNVTQHFKDWENSRFARECRKWE